MKVLKFGGTSVGSSESIALVKDIIVKASASEQVVVVVSAMSGVTDLILKCCRLAEIKDYSYKDLLKTLENKHFNAVKGLIQVNNQGHILSIVKQKINSLETLLDGVSILSEGSRKTLDSIVSYGELLSSEIIAKYFLLDGLDVTLKDSRELIVTDDSFGKANINFEATNLNCISYFGSTNSRIVVLPGFIASTANKETTTLGRGGSDYSASIIASALNASVLEIWTDVSGMYSANPSVVKQAKPIEALSYKEAMELSHFGAKVLYPPTLQPILDKNITVVIKNTFEPDAKGTTITNRGDSKASPVKGITNIDKVALITFEGIGFIGISGTCERFFTALSKENINIILITQASSEHSICIGVNESDAEAAKEAIDKGFQLEIKQKKVLPSVVQYDLSILAVVGEGMKNHQGLSGKLFSTLGRNNVNVLAIAQGASELNISAVIKSSDIKKALNSLHESFFEEYTKDINLFVCGAGNVGQKFLSQIDQQKKYLKEHFKLNVKVIALSNTKTMCFSENGIDLKDWKSKLASGTPASQKAFFDNVLKLNMRNSIFVDNTASGEVAENYAQYLENSISIVTCNKIACSSKYENYVHLKTLSRKYNAALLFETNVGAALPIIDTLKNLIASGDTITKIQAVLSGSLNFVFNNFNENVSFYDVVKQAKEEGYTEPDPKIDLSGVDVARKILILVRESGYQMDIESIENIPFLPKACMDAVGIESFFKSLQDHAEHFNNLYKEATKENCRLKYVASFENGKAKVGLEKIPHGHPFYNLEGKDNIVLFYTKRYQEQPLLIKGAGAGAEVTASGIFADIIRVGNLY